MGQKGVSVGVEANSGSYLNTESYTDRNPTIDIAGGLLSDDIGFIMT